MTIPLTPMPSSCTLLRRKTAIGERKVNTILEKISLRLANARVLAGGNPQHLSWYAYRAELRLNMFLTYGTMVLIALVAWRPLEAVLFLAFLIPLRKVAGGYHAHRHWICYVSSVGSFYVGIFFLPPLEQRFPVLGYLLLALAGVLVLGLAPVIHPNLPQCKGQKAKMRLFAYGILFLELALILVFSFFRIPQSFLWASCNGMLVASILLLIAKLMKQEGDVNYEK